jgi:hypothetical protein
VDTTSTVKMASCYGAPRPARIRTGPRTDRRSAACTAHVRCGDGEARGARASMHRGVRVSLGKERGLGRRRALVGSNPCC